MTELPILDPEAIANLRALGGDDGDAFLREIVGIFLADTPLRLEELDSSLASGDVSRFTRAAHSIKGSSSNLGAQALQFAANRLEAKSRENAGGLASGVADLKAEFQRVRAALDRLLADSAAVPPAPIQR
jgi:HPt (histidine-containing phosphotransfer) domain-containing protein